MKNINSQDKKVLVKNFTHLSSLKIITTFLPLVTLPYVLRVIEFEKYGIIVMATALVSYFYSLTDFSFKISGTRDIAVFKHSQKKINIIVSQVFTIKSLFLLISFAILSIIIFSYQPFYENRLIYFLTSFSLLGYAYSLDWFFLGMEKMQYISIIQIVVKSLFTILVFVLINVKSDFWIYPLLISSSTVLITLVSLILLITKFKVRFVQPKLKSIIRLIKIHIPLFINQFLPNLYNNTSTFLLGIFTSYELVGVFGTIKKVTTFGESLLNIISRVFYPFLNRKREAFISYKKVMFSLSLILMIGFALLSPLVFKLLTIEFSTSIYVYLILLIGTIGYAIYDVYGLNYFIIRRQDQFVMRNTLKFSLIGFILAFPLIHFFGVLGAAANLAISRWLIGGSLYLKYRSQLS